MKLPLKYTETGKEILEILNKKSNILKMIRATESNIPPVALLQEELKEVLDKIEIFSDFNEYKKFVGRSIRDILKGHGYVVLKKLTVKTDGHFNNGALYIKTKI